jgi:hypothetical protein
VKGPQGVLSVAHHLSVLVARVVRHVRRMFFGARADERREPADSSDTEADLIGQSRKSLFCADKRWRSRVLATSAALRFTRFREWRGWCVSIFICAAECAGGMTVHEPAVFVHARKRGAAMRACQRVERSARESACNRIHARRHPLSIVAQWIGGHETQAPVNSRQCVPKCRTHQILEDCRLHCWRTAELDHAICSPTRGGARVVTDHVPWMTCIGRCVQCAPGMLDRCFVARFNRSCAYTPAVLRRSSDACADGIRPDSGSRRRIIGLRPDVNRGRATSNSSCHSAAS